MKATAAYVRVSSDKQDVSSQKQSIERWAAKNQPIDLWFEDASGKNPRDLPQKRQGFQAMLQAVEAGIIGTIVVDKQDRFGTRDAHQLGAFFTTLRDNGCRLLDASGDELTADGFGAVIKSVVGALASTEEQRNKAHRNVRGKLPKAQRGEYLGGYPPFGFDVVCCGPDEKWRTVYVGHFDRWKVYPDGRRERFSGKDNAPAKDPSDTLYIRPTIEKQRLKVVREIFKWYVTESISPSQIATRLNLAKVDAVFAGAWNKVKIRQMLSNPAYIGLPAWNKRGASRFVEFVGGEVREVPRSSKGGRRRSEADFLQPEKPVFKPIIEAETWQRAQEKLKESSDEQRGRRKRPAKTDDLWLKPFLVCGRCGGTMRATRGGSTERLWPSYYCGTYGTYGKTNPTSCRCHRVRHAILEEIVLDYIREACPKTAELMEAVDGGNLELAQPLLKSLFDTRGQLDGLACDLMTFVAEHATEEEEQGVDFLTAYGRAYSRIQPQLLSQIQQHEAELDKMLDSYTDLPASLKEPAKKRMEAKQGIIDRLKGHAEDLREPWDGLRAELAARREAYEQAREVLGNGAGGRRKAEVLSRVVERIVCHFDHAGKKSKLAKVDIVPIVAQGISPEQG